MHNDKVVFQWDCHKCWRDLGKRIGIPLAVAAVIGFAILMFADLSEPKQVPTPIHQNPAPLPTEPKGKG